MVERVRRARQPEKVAATGSRKVLTHVYGKESSSLDEAVIEVFDTEPAYVRVNAGVTKNLGNYESLRVDVSISMPCYREHVEETYEAIADQVSKLLADEVDSYMDGVKKGS